MLAPNMLLVLLPDEALLVLLPVVFLPVEVLLVACWLFDPPHGFGSGSVFSVVGVSVGFIW